MAKHDGKTIHYWRIHGKVTKALWRQLPVQTREAIAFDPEAEQGLWFAKKVEADATRLYEDPAYWDNALATFSTDTDEARLEALHQERIKA